MGVVSDEHCRYLCRCAILNRRSGGVSDGGGKEMNISVNSGPVNLYNSLLPYEVAHGRL